MLWGLGLGFRFSGRHARSTNLRLTISLKVEDLLIKDRWSIHCKSSGGDLGPRARNRNPLNPEARNPKLFRHRNAPLHSQKVLYQPAFWYLGHTCRNQGLGFKEQAMA